ncbi:hypothetical protein ARTSIC4J27_229 [Pseudarthrobacter siccitolerans]|uniref:Uncharacterized protein n=1 Tax=Pseudarthrobacter siccitolerans TaxID=861266 RepID=A0A024GWK2_9MICC|nr:hypothetical protein ARTSIC4J27_229 [Pseudarthrobacter siccitolerans]
MALAQHGADLALHGREIKDHETRLRVLENTPTVSPRTLWTVVASAAGLVLAAVPIIERILA